MKYALRKTIGALSAGTRVVILDEWGTGADIQTLYPMPHVLGEGITAIWRDRPILTGIRKDWLVKLREGRNNDGCDRLQHAGGI